ncbi:putative sulfite oxidase subunit YedZ [Gluconobacter morbifer G707]|uniref:Protein-methionine-sulfoxide reductase heme-binding subunit MsrQ n=2 Tax=Gluconobacter TaxID=441 RepID=G6XG98_9PROT|nr:putative sulfite oxidase subunit YedZ [Gluconobacter morbifer G707]
MRMLRRHWRIVLYPIGLVPAGWLLWQGQHGQLGADPVNVFERSLGLWAFRFLTLCLMLAPLRAITGINLLRYRRLTGLLAFFYALLHFCAYVGLDIHFDWHVLWKDITSRLFLIFGMMALLLLFPLALTSNAASMRWLKRGWKRLHWLIYPSACLASLHFFLSFKTLNSTTGFYLSIMAAVLMSRLPFVKNFLRTVRRPGAGPV